MQETVVVDQESVLHVTVCGKDVIPDYKTWLKKKHVRFLFALLLLSREHGYVEVEDVLLFIEKHFNKRYFIGTFASFVKDARLVPYMLVQVVTTPKKENEKHEAPRYALTVTGKQFISALRNDPEEQDLFMPTTSTNIVSRETISP